MNEGVGIAIRNISTEYKSKSDGINKYGELVYELDNIIDISNVIAFYWSTFDVLSLRFSYFLRVDIQLLFGDRNERKNFGGNIN